MRHVFQFSRRKNATVAFIQSTKYVQFFLILCVYVVPDFI